MRNERTAFWVSENGALSLCIDLKVSLLDIAKQCYGVSAYGMF